MRRGGRRYVQCIQMAKYFLETWGSLSAKGSISAMMAPSAHALLYANRLRTSPPGALSPHHNGVTIGHGTGVTVQSELTGEMTMNRLSELWPVLDKAKAS